jgi:hypothetical protein
MSVSANRGNQAEHAANVRVDAEAAASWLERREETLSENSQRKVRRETCLRDSALVGGGAGTLGAYLMYRSMQHRSAGFRAFLGGGGQSFQVFVAFFMPFM